MIAITPKTVLAAAKALRERAGEDAETRLKRRIRSMSTNDLAMWVETATMSLGAALSQWQRDGEHYALLEAQHVNAQMTYALLELDRRVTSSVGQRPVG
jgi:hypothetical protein